MSRKYIALPSHENPWYLLPADDAGPFHYFVNYVFSSRHPKRQWLVAALRLATRAGAYRLWPWAARFLPCWPADR